MGMCIQYNGYAIVARALSGESSAQRGACTESRHGGSHTAQREYILASVSSSYGQDLQNSDSQVAVLSATTVLVHHSKCSARVLALLAQRARKIVMEMHDSELSTLIWYVL